MNSTKHRLRLIPFAWALFTLSTIVLFVTSTWAQSDAESETNIAGDQLTLLRNGKEHQLVGDILIEAQDDSLYFVQNNGRVWFVQPDEIKKRVDSDVVAPRASFDAIEEELLEELPDGFKIYRTKHYLIAYQTEYVYAKWLAQLYEGRLYKSFDGFWQRKKKLSLEQPEYPLVVLAFKSKAEYQRYTDRVLGPGQDLLAYFNLESNRVVMYDMTVGERHPGEKISARRIEEIFQEPIAIRMVATIVHEGTHQLMFNRGVQTRFADRPLWLHEGLAMFFEAPNVKNNRGWSRPGLVFDQRLYRFRNTLQNRPANSIERLITDDARLINPETAVDGYAEAWAFSHFLLNRRSKEYIAYLKELSQMAPLSTADSEQRMATFKAYFGDDLEKLERDFLRYVRRLK